MTFFDASKGTFFEIITLVNGGRYRSRDEDYALEVLESMGVAGRKPLLFKIVNAGPGTSSLFIDSI